MPDTMYDRDFHAWANEQATLLREGRVADADLEHIAEEIASLGRGERRELVSRLTILMVHLLKWEHQPARRGRSWMLSVREQRRKIARHMRDNPSLKATISDAVTDAWEDALIEAERQTGIALEEFPQQCPWSYDAMLNGDFWPS